MKVALIANIALPVAAVLAGLVVFLIGMSIMSEALQGAAGNRLRHILERSTHRRFNAMTFGSVLGFLIHSSAASVMLVGFISAGLMTFGQSIPVMLGINVGTTFSMLLISFRLGDACWIAIVAGLLLSALRPDSRTAALGKAMFGFGLIFLGMNLMSDAIRPFRAELAPYLAHADGTTLRGMFIGVSISVCITAIIQSSGATIGMTFAMISAGVITSLEQAWPIILGANVGTCATALLGSIGTTAPARRSAMAHLIFNLFSAATGMLIAPLIYLGIPWTSPVLPEATPEAARQALIHQCANANALKMVATALIALPFTGFLATLVSRITPGRKTAPPLSRLNPDLLTRPEDALHASLDELCRLTGICRQSLQGQSRLLAHPDAAQARDGNAAEALLDTIKVTMHSYLRELTGIPLSRRQSILLPLLYSGIDHLERIGDHIEKIAELSIARHQRPEACFSTATLEAFKALNHHACHVLARLQQALDPDVNDHRQTAESVLEARDAYMQLADRQRSRIARDLSSGRGTPTTAIFRAELLSNYSRIVKHAKALALAAQDQDFHIKNKKLDRTPP